MTDIVIKAESLGKHYTIGHQAANGRYVALRDVLVNNARNFALSLWRYREAIRPFQENKSSKLWRFPRNLPLMLRNFNLGTT